MKQRKIPLRMCTGCAQMKPKKELVRVVKSPEIKDENGESQGFLISLDFTGKKPGRGAYVCKDITCLKKARKARRFEKAFSCKIPEEVFDDMEAKISE